ncbi:MAG: hypothetical protein NOU37_00845 [Candidatus Brocadiales bacterium]|nr:hypothetical protein [Candidatus Bathyanammoxibius amoris]
MAHKKFKKGQETHDRKVAAVAANAKAHGARGVKVALPGHKQPPKIAGRIPDVSWKKPDGTPTIREIDTGELIGAEKKQDKAFKEWAKQNNADYKRLKT